MAKRGLDYYGALGISKSATDTEIKEAYRYFSLQFNPYRYKDQNLDEIFCLIGESYEVLSDPLLKSIYDHYGEAGMKKGVLTPVGWHPAWVYHGEPLRTFKRFFGTANPYADLMYCMRDQVSVFKANNLEEVRVKEQPMERDLELTLEEIYHGTMKKFKIQRQVYDDERITTNLQEKVICVNIKPGMPNGTKIVFQGVGDDGPGISPGDLILTIKDLPHERFKRSGVNLHIGVSLDLCQSLEKLIVELNTLDNRIIRFAITDVIVPDFIKIIHGEGMPYVNDDSKKGDLIIKFDVVMPAYLDERKRKKLIEALLEEGDDIKETPENLYKLWMTERLKRIRIYGDSSKYHLDDGKEEEMVEEEEKEKEEEPQICTQVKINKDQLYRL